MPNSTGANRHDDMILRGSELFGFFPLLFRAPLKRCVREVAAKTDFKTLTRFLLPRGFIPPVVPEVDTVTVGGAISGLVMESSSFRYGFVHNAVTSMAAWSDWRG